MTTVLIIISALLITSLFRVMFMGISKGYTKIEWVECCMFIFIFPVWLLCVIIIQCNKNIIRQKYSEKKKEEYKNYEEEMEKSLSLTLSSISSKNEDE